MVLRSSVAFRTSWPFTQPLAVLFALPTVCVKRALDMEQREEVQAQQWATWPSFDNQLSHIVQVACALQTVRVNWAYEKEQREEALAQFHVFVGDLPGECSDAALLQTFRACPGCCSARVLWDHTLQRSKGYGFVAFRCGASVVHSCSTTANFCYSQHKYSHYNFLFIQLVCYISDVMFVLSTVLS